MIAALTLVALALRKGLALRRLRHAGAKGRGSLIAAHARVARPAVIAILIGLIGGPISTVWLRGWEPLHTFHGWTGLLAAVLFGTTGYLGWQMLRGESRAVDAHGWLGLGAVLVAAVAAVAGFVLLP